jgi:hypothetical protein
MRSEPPARAFPGDSPPPTKMAYLKNGNTVSMTLALAPITARQPAANVVLASDAVRLNAGQTHIFTVDDATLATLGSIFPTKPPSMPIVEDPNVPLWIDRANPDHFFYPPEFTIVESNPADDPNTSSFGLTFREIGHDNQGSPVLEGEVHFMLRRGISDATKKLMAANGGGKFSPVTTNGLSVQLSLPYRDTNNQVRRVDLTGTVEDHGDTITVRVPLINQYLRVAYGDLAISGFQTSQAQLKVAYIFDAIIPVQDLDLRLLYIDKLAITPIHYSPEDIIIKPGQRYIDAQHLSYRAENASLLFQREAPLATNRELEKLENRPALEQPAGKCGPRPAEFSQIVIPEVSNRSAASNKLETAVSIRPETATFFHPVSDAVAVHEPIPVDLLRLQDVLKQKRYVQQTLGRSTAINAFFPCNTLGAFYRQDLGDQIVSIGCQDSFSLGKADLKLFELVDDPALTSVQYKVYRSLSQPGRFMILPAVYRVTRYSPAGGEQAYHPVIYLYSSLDANQPENNECVVMASLQPDLPGWVRKDIEAKLKRLHHAPITQYITEIESELAYSWALSGGPIAIQPQAVKLWDSFQVTLSTDLAGGLQLQSILAHTGVIAQVNFKLKDDMTLSSALILDLANLTGPWDGGPLKADLQGAQVALTNHIERGINVSDLIVYTADGVSQPVRVDRLLAANETITLALPTAAAEAYPVYILQPGGPADLTEISSFVEDIHTNVVFVNLINYANHNLKQLDLQVRLQGVAGSQKAVPISEAQPISEAPFILPLTTYLGSRILEFQVTKTDTSNHSTTTAWLTWDLCSRGNVISLEWSFIQ